jgi:GntR family transcriptional regulator, arabinose operon transcriptional repressor
MAQAKHRQIYKELRGGIKSGQYKEGERLPTEAQLAKRYATSRPTVARALLDLQHEGLLNRRAGSGTYVTRVVEQGHLFGLIIPRLGETEIFDPICREMTRSSQAASYALLWASTTAEADGDVAEQVWQSCQQCISRRVSGIFFAPVEWIPDAEEVNEKLVEALDAAHVPVVLLDRDLYPYPRRSRYDRVGIDNRAAGFAVADHLLSLGCREIGFLSRPYSAETVSARIAGYRDALAKYDVTPPPSWIAEGDASDPQFVRHLLDAARVKAFICANDITAANLMHTLDVIGLRTPDDLRIVGIDDVKYASLLRVPLTTLHQPCQHIGNAAVKAMVERIATPSLPPRDILFQGRIVVRNSCGAATGTTT